MAGISNTYDPTSTAQAMAESFTSGRQTILTRQTQTASATEKALGTLGSALNTFQSSLLAMTGVNKTISAYSAAFSDTSVASATAGATATAGSYAFFVKQVASAQKLSYSSMSDFAGQGSLTLGAGSNSFTLQLNTKPNWSVRDLAAAINAAPGNTSVSASVVSTGIVNGVPTSELVLTSKQTGADNAISLSTSGVDANLATRLGAPAELAKPLDAIVNVGSEAGTEIRQASNTLNVIDGVTMTLSKAQTTGSAPVTLTVATDPSKTTSNAQAFVDAYNKLKSAIDGLVSPGDPTAGDAAGAFSGDSGVRALRDRLVGMLRGSGSTSLASFGILAARDGSLSLDSARMTKALATNPTGLDTLIGSTAAGSTSGIAGQLDSYLKLWTNSADGQIGRRKEVVGKLQGDLTERQTALDRQYDSAYKRYLTQFTQLQSVQSSMSYNTSLFDALFSSSKD
ncbi:flagellar filament capping protein FliD [Massilia sp. Dwa41.01b]|uniref:flagellar filament capping protein FliD n=1 Tax=unclassified Massilia TaxID=2609279 RepID=UPI001602ED37|nr:MULTISPECIES: flagellar filament capping protein FliD [unclassified Massilia]QNA88211.1 flagellar filament capping protein FliD [Massilia sp. Dwa41.01b]QNA99113.1 flagellar filament capping protein FliD [Massilia sp. Se16.2.3]